MPNEKLLTKEEFFADYDADLAQRTRWQSLALARAVAFAVERYRREHKLSQRALAVMLGIRPAHVARIELGEYNPSIETLGRLANILGTRFVIEVAPAGSSSENLTLPSGLAVVQETIGPDGSRVVVAVG